MQGPKLVSSVLEAVGDFASAFVATQAASWLFALALASSLDDLDRRLVAAEMGRPQEIVAALRRQRAKFYNALPPAMASLVAEIRQSQAAGASVMIEGPEKG